MILNVVVDEEVCPTYVGMNREISIVGAVEQRMPHGCREI